jgi:hypothetical protein
MANSLRAKTQRFAATLDPGRPAVTTEQYERGREVLDALPPGIYLKCFKCRRWQRGGEVTFMSDAMLCEKCAT